MALIRDYELPGTGLTVSNAYHVVTKVDVEKRMQDFQGPVDTTQPDGITAGSQEEGKEVFWKAGYIGTITITVWKDGDARASGSEPIGYLGVNPAEQKYDVGIATPGEDVGVKFFIDNSLTASYTEQAYTHLLTTDYYSGSAVSA